LLNVVSVRNSVFSRIGGKSGHLAVIIADWNRLKKTTIGKANINLQDAEAPLQRKTYL
jgi:hypothetical protein